MDYAVKIEDMKEKIQKAEALFEKLVEVIREAVKVVAEIASKLVDMVMKIILVKGKWINLARYARKFRTRKKYWGKIKKQMIKALKS